MLSPILLQVLFKSYPLFSSFGEVRRILSNSQFEETETKWFTATNDRASFQNFLCLFPKTPIFLPSSAALVGHS